MTDLYYRPHLREAPALLPFSTQTPDGEWRTDLANHPESVEECGFRLAPPRPDDTETQTAEWDADAEAWVMVDRPPLPPPPPAPEAQPAILGKLQFIVLAQSAGGMTDAMLVEAQGNPAFAAFWIKYQMAQEVRRDDPITRGSLDALSAGGYLPKGKEAVLAAWPVA